MNETVKDGVLSRTYFNCVDIDGNTNIVRFYLRNSDVVGIDSKAHAVRTTKSPTGPLGAQNLSSTLTIAIILTAINNKPYVVQFDVEITKKTNRLCIYDIKK